MAKKGRRKGAHRELDRAGALAVAFANTAAPRPDRRRKDSKAPPAAPLATYAELLAWTQRMGVVGAVDGELLGRSAAGRAEEAAAVVADAHALRAALLRVFTALALEKEPRRTDLECVNRGLRVRKVFREDEGFSRDWGEAGALDRLLWPIAESAAEVLASEKHRRIRQCATQGCFRLFVRAHPRRRWCDDATCGSRARGRRHHESLRRAKSRIAAMSPVEMQRYFERQEEKVERRRAEMREWEAAWKGRAREESDGMRARRAESEESPEAEAGDAGPEPVEG